MPPTYDYKCDEGHEIEVEQSIKDDALTTCQFLTQINKEECEGLEGYGKRGKFVKCGASCRRLISKISFKFKGGAPTPKHYQ